MRSKAGAARVILGTAAFTDPDLLRQALDAHGPERVLVVVDVRGGRVATARLDADQRAHGTEAVLDALARAAACGSSCYTNVDRDGMLDGANLEEVRWVRARRCSGQRDLLGRHRQARGPGSARGLRAS